MGKGEGGQMALRAASRRLIDSVPKEVVDDIYRCSFKKQTGVSLKYMLDFSSMPLERQMLLSAQFLHKELPVRLAHRVAELENLPHGLSTKEPVRKVRDWYVSSFRDLRSFNDVTDIREEVRRERASERERNVHEKHAYTHTHVCMLTPAIQTYRLHSRRLHESAY